MSTWLLPLFRLATLLLASIEMASEDGHGVRKVPTPEDVIDRAGKYNKFLHQQGTLP
jgi:hypothetical protein